MLAQGGHPQTLHIRGITYRTQGRKLSFTYTAPSQGSLINTPTDDPAAFLGPAAPERGVAGVDDRYGDRQRSSGM